MKSAAPTLAEFRATVRDWCREHVPADWRRRRPECRTRSSCASRRSGSRACARQATPCRTGRRNGAAGCPVAEQVVLYQELAAHDAPRLVLPFVSIHHAASTLLAAGTDAAAGAPPAGDPRRRDLVPGVLRARRRIGHGCAHDERTQGRRYVRRQRAEAVGERRDARRLVPAARPHRSRRPEAPRHFVLPDGHAHTRNRGTAHPAGDRRIALLRDLPRRRDIPGDRPRRSRERRLAGRTGDARRRTRDDHARTRRAAGQRRIPVARRVVRPTGAARDDATRRSPGRRPARPVRDRTHRTASVVRRVRRG